MLSDDIWPDQVSYLSSHTFFDDGTSSFSLCTVNKHLDSWRGVSSGPEDVLAARDRSRGIKVSCGLRCPQTLLCASKGVSNAFHCCNFLEKVFASSAARTVVGEGVNSTIVGSFARQDCAPESWVKSADTGDEHALACAGAGHRESRRGGGTGFVGARLNPGAACSAGPGGRACWLLMITIPMVIWLLMITSSPSARFALLKITSSPSARCCSFLFSSFFLGVLLIWSPPVQRAPRSPVSSFK